MGSAVMELERVTKEELELVLEVALEHSSENRLHGGNRSFFK